MECSYFVLNSCQLYVNRYADPHGPCLATPLTIPSTPRQHTTPRSRWHPQAPQHAADAHTIHRGEAASVAHASEHAHHFGHRTVSVHAMPTHASCDSVRQLAGVCVFLYHVVWPSGAHAPLYLSTRRELRPSADNPAALGLEAAHGGRLARVALLRACDHGSAWSCVRSFASIWAVYRTDRGPVLERGAGGTVPTSVELHEHVGNLCRFVAQCQFRAKHLSSFRPFTRTTTRSRVRDR